MIKQFTLFLAFYISYSLAVNCYYGSSDYFIEKRMIHPEILMNPSLNPSDYDICTKVQVVGEKSITYSFGKSKEWAPSSKYSIYEKCQTDFCNVPHDLT